MSLFGDDRTTQRPTTNAAMEQAKRLGRGINILGYDAIWKSPNEARFQERHFAQIHDAGFDHIRINLHPLRDGKPDGQLSEAYWRTLDWAIQYALRSKLAVILDVHQFPETANEPAARKEWLLAIWGQIAERYRDAPRDVYFEILNEPHEQLTPALWNQWLREALAVIRRTNPRRMVIVGPGHWNSIDLLEELALPEDDPNIIVTIHYYDPFGFTHQGTPWTEHKDSVGVDWKGDEQDCLAIQRDFKRAQAWSERHHRPLYLGEFGAYDKAETPSRIRYLSFVAREAEKHGWSWAYWQFDSDFVLYDMRRQQWVRPLLDALIPSPKRQNFQANPP